MSVRKQAVMHIKQESEYFEAFLGEEFDAYCNEMGQEGTWGDELTLVRAHSSLIFLGIEFLKLSFFPFVLMLPQP